MITQSLTILLIEDNPEFADLVRLWLAGRFSRDANLVLICKDSLRTGLQRLEQAGVDVVLLDLGLPDSSGYETLLRAKAVNQAAPIIVLSADDDEALALQMVQRGAQDYLVKSSCTAEILGRAIQYALIRHTRQPDACGAPELAKTIAIVGAKGGVGATTFACNLGAELRRQTKGEALLLDLDVNAGLVGFLTNVRSPRSLLDVFENLDHLDRSCWAAMVSKGPFDMDVLGSPCLLGRECVDPVRVREMLSMIRPFYRWIVADFGRLGDFQLGLLSQADEVYLVTTNQILAIYETKRILDHLRSLGFMMDRVRLIIRETEYSSPIQGKDLDQLFGAHVAQRLSNVEQELQEAYTAGRLPSEKGVFRHQIAALARRVAGLPPEEPSKRRLPLFGKTSLLERREP